ncbi:MAG TPA: DUF1549 domain-containing protein [Bryobacteraceae bacterium]|nr:DUF1549 domain-containing protein [Bryobacteraceae bacterium]
MKHLPVFAVLCGSLAAQSLAILPNNIELNGPEARQQLIAEAASGRYNEDCTHKAKWTSANPQIATVDEHGLVRPAGDGETTITAAANGAAASVRVVVKNSHAPFTWSFKNHVIPVLTKMGCNQGACHGALAGKNGFKLTLRGYDPDVDYDTLTRQAAARRVSLADPPNSLILLKPTFAIPHGGGQRFKKGSLEYRIISEWIAAGTPPPSPNEPDVIGLQVFPKSAVLKAGTEQQLSVRAKYSDGHVEDVTRWVKYSSSNEGVATVDDNGLVKMNGSGEAAVTLWYSSRVLYARLTVPYDRQVAASAYESFPRRNYIDDFVLAKLKALNIAPSRLASDSVFIRRAYLDAAGILPTAEEVENFLADPSPDKRARLIDHLLTRDEFVDYWAYKWSDLLLVSSKRLRPAEMWSFYDWIRDSVKKNKPWDAFVREIFLSSGSTREHGALNYFVLHKNPIDLAENVTQAFLGQRLTCARCHNHPLEKWTQKQYYEFANLFSRVGIKNGATPGDVVVFAKVSGDINHPRLGRPLPPTPLDGQSLSLDVTADRRVAFANWLTSPSNPYFARALVNRVWGNFMGRGLVHPVDDLRATNPASNEELLSALTKDFIEHGYDVQYLIRTIMNSGTYQLSSEANATNQNDDIYYSKYIVKRLPAEVILDAMSQVTGVPTRFTGYPEGTRAMQLPDSQVASQFLTSFGRPPRNVCDASERSSDPNVAQALHVINGDTLNKKISSPDGYVALFLKLGLSERRIIDQLYLSAFSRYPTGDERQAIAAALAPAWSDSKGDGRRQALEDLLWAMLTSKEFLFNH